MFLDPISKLHLIYFDLVFILNLAPILEIASICPLSRVMSLNSFIMLFRGMRVGERVMEQATLRQHARDLRKNSTDAERHLWYYPQTKSERYALF